MLQYRGMHATTSSNTPAATSNASGTVNNRYYSKSPPCFGNGLGRSAPIGFANQLSSKASSSSYGSANVSSSQIGAFHSASSVSAAPLVIGGKQSIQQQLGHVEEIIATGSWATKAGAVILGAAAAGSLFLGPIDRLRGGGGGGGGGGGDPNPGGGSGGGGGTFQHKFDSQSKEDEDEKAKLSVGVTTAPRPYEVS